MDQDEGAKTRNGEPPNLQSAIAVEVLSELPPQACADVVGANEE